MQPEGFLIDVPITLSVSVRGVGLTEGEAKRIAREYADNIQTRPHSLSSFLQMSTRHNAPQATEASLESSTKNECEVLAKLAPVDNSVGEHLYAQTVSKPKGFWTQGTEHPSLTVTHSSLEGR